MDIYGLHTSSKINVCISNDFKLEASNSSAHFQVRLQGGDHSALEPIKSQVFPGSGFFLSARAWMLNVLLLVLLFRFFPRNRGPSCADAEPVLQGEGLFLQTFIRLPSSLPWCCPSKSFNLPPLLRTQGLGSWIEGPSLQDLGDPLLFLPSPTPPTFLRDWPWVLRWFWAGPRHTRFS